MKSLRTEAGCVPIDEPFAPIVLRPYACSAVQQKILVAIALFWKEKGRSPSFVDIAWAIGYQGVGGLHRVIAQLRNVGALTQPLVTVRRAARTLKLNRRLCLAKLPEGYTVYEAIGRIE